MIIVIRFQDRVTHQQVLDRAGSTSIESMLLKAQLRWTGHVIKMIESRIPKQLPNAELMQGPREQGRPKLRFNDTMKSNLKWNSISPRELEASTAYRPAWESLTSQAAAAFKEDRRQRLAPARDRRHRAEPPSIQTTDYSCNTCGLLCASSFGLHSHALSSLRTQTLSSPNTE